MRWPPIYRRKSFTSSAEFIQKAGVIPEFIQKAGVIPFDLEKKTVAAPDDVPKGWTQVTPTPDDVPEGWTAWAMPRGDKIYIDASGKRYMSMKEVEKAIR